MRVFWNAAEEELASGQDILGIRSTDQGIEQSWVGSITTVSQRARYFTLLPWVIHEFYERELNGSTRAEFDRGSLDNVVRALDFIVLLSTTYDAEMNESGPMNGSIGSSKFSGEVRAFRENGAVAIPEHQGAMSLDAYLGPSRTLGLLVSMDDRPTPIQLPPRGLEVAEVRNRGLADCPLVRLIFSGGTIREELIAEWWEHFSLNGLRQPAAKAERELLRQALIEPSSEEEEQQEQYERFGATLHWILGCTKSAPTNANDLLRDNLCQMAKEGEALQPRVEREFAEYELRRITHHRLEILLGAFTETLQEVSTASVGRVVDIWSSLDLAPGAASTLWSVEVGGFAREFDNLVGMASATESEFDAHADVLTALRELLDARRVYHRLVNHEALEARPNEGMEQAFKILDRYENRGATVASALEEILRQVVISAHLQTTYRKMSNGLPCSLRFFSEGERLVPTGQDVSPGRSNGRLTRLFGIMRDVGWLELVDDGKSYAPTQAGLGLAEQLEVAR